MIRTFFAMAVAAFVFAAVYGTSQAAPIAPLPAGVAADTSHSDVTHVWWRRGWHRHCWRGRWGHMHCW